MACTLLPGTAGAVPSASSPAEAARLVADASHQLEIVSEQVNTAREELRHQQAASKLADRSATLAREHLDALDGQMRQIARSAYTSDGLTQFDLMLSSSSAEDFVSSLGTLDAIAGHTSAVVDQVAQAADRARQAQTTAETAARDAQRTLDRITAKQKELQSRKAEYQRQYDRLSRPQRQVVATLQGGRAATPTAVRAAAAPAVVRASGPAAQAAVNTALAQVGDPYVWGAAGPNAFDCSGLTQYAYAAAGIALPHSSGMQAGMGTPVSRSQLQPGDLVFFYSPVSHVGMYIGNGMMVHASTSGQPVKVVSLDSMPGYNSARRVG
jgi:cell wall-associated NlpC family hydrolase